MEIESSEIPKRTIALTNKELIREIQKPMVYGYSLNELKTEFYNRFKNRLYQHCKRFCYRNRYDESLVKDFFQETFIKAFSKIEEFIFDQTISDEKLKNTISVWLNKIAFNSFLDYLTERAKLSPFNDSLEDSNYELSDEFEFNNQDNNSVKLQEGWDDLNDKEKLILYWSIKCNCLGNNKHLPDNIIDDICQKLRIQKGYIRLIKLRALAKIRSKF